jgi:hypothetical protein
MADTGMDSLSDSDSDCGSEQASKRIKLAKVKGAAVYKTKFNPAWSKIYPFVHEVSGKAHKFRLVLHVTVLIIMTQ